MHWQYQAKRNFLVGVQGYWVITILTVGNDSEMYSGEPIKLMLKDAQSIDVNGNTSAVVCNGKSKAYMWGYFYVNNRLFKALKPVQIDAGRLVSIDKIRIDCNMIALLGVTKENKTAVVLQGTPGELDLNRPFNPATPPAELLHTLELPMKIWEEDQVQDLAVHNGTVFLLKKGNVFIRSIVDDSNTQINFNGNLIESMKISRNSAIFKSGQLVFTFLAPPRPYPSSSPSLWSDFLLGKQAQSEPVVIKSLLEVIQTERPVELKMENPELITCGWSHFLVSESDKS